MNLIAKALTGKLTEKDVNAPNGAFSCKSQSAGSVDDSESYRCACGCFLTVEGAWVGESHYDDFAKVYCSNPKCKLKKPNDTMSRPTHKL